MSYSVSPSFSTNTNLTIGTTFGGQVTSFGDNRIFEVNYEGMTQWEYIGEFVNVHRAIKYADGYLNNFIIGDINQDDTINVVDIVLLVQIILEGEATEQQLYLADYNQDGAINVVDIVQVVNYILNQ